MKNKGITIVELLVVVSITAVIASLILGNFAQFGTRVNLNLAAQQALQALRKAQTFASSVRETGGLFPGYGVHIDMTSPDTVILFADTDAFGNKIYDLEDVVAERTVFEAGSVITDICIEPPRSCGKNSLDVVFLRPEPSITITADGVSSITNAEVILGGAHPDVTKRVRIWITGQISTD